MFIKAKLVSLWKNDLWRRLTSGAAWSLGAALCTSIGNLASGILLAHILGKYTYGQYGLIRTTLNMFIVFSSFSLGATATKYIAEYRDKDKEKTGRIAGLSLMSVFSLAVIAFAVCYFGANPLSERSFHSIEMSPYLRLGATMIFFAVINSALTGILSGFEAFQQIAKINVVGGIVLIFASFVAGKYFGLGGAVVGLSVYLGCMVAISVWYLKQELKKHRIVLYIRESIQEISILWKFSLPATLGGILVAPVLWLGSIMLVKSPAGFDGMAGFDVINQWKMAVLFVPGVVSRIALPLLSNLNSAEQNGDYNRVIKFNLLLNVGIASLAALALSAVSPFILRLYGKGFEEYMLPFFIMMFGAVVCAANTIIGHIIFSKGFAWWGFVLNFLWAALFLTFSYYFVMVRFLGVLGIALSYAVSYLGHTFGQSLFLFFLKGDIRKAGL